MEVEPISCKKSISEATKMRSHGSSDNCCTESAPIELLYIFGISSDNSYEVAV